MSSPVARKSGAVPLLAGVLLTLALAAGVIMGVYRSSVPASSYPKIDPVEVRQLIREGKISGRSADHFEEILPP